MRASLLLLSAVSLSAMGALIACGDSGGTSTFVTPPIGTVPGDPSGCFGCDAGLNEGGGPSGGIVIESMRVDPPDASITIAPGGVGTQAFRVLAKMKGQTQEEDITARSVFYVPDNYLVGTFPATGAATLTTRLPATPADPPQRGGKLTVQAQAANFDKSIVTVTTSLTVKLSAASLNDPSAAPALPANPGAKFAGTLDASRAPNVVYPNDGVMLPPNLRRLDVHWDGGAGNNLYELRFVGTNSTITYYTRCNGGAGFVADKCGFQLDQKAYAYVAATNNGGTVKLKIRGTDEATGGAGGTYGESTELTMSFAENNVEGGLYYWSIDNPPATSRSRIMRVDFGNPTANVEEFLVPGQDTLADQCVGCHTLSRDGKKLVASVGGQWDGRLVYLNDLSKPKGSAGWLTQNGAANGAPATNRVQFASFDPKGTQFVAVYGDVNPGLGNWPPTMLPSGSDTPPSYQSDRNKLFFHDGNTGLRTTSKDLPFRPDHPDWSPDGTMIAVTSIPASAPSTTTTQRPTRGGLELLKQVGGVWQDPTTLVASQLGKNRINPNFVPDSSFLLYTEATCPAGSPDSEECDGDADPSARTFAMKPAAGSAPVLLAKAATPGKADTAADVGDTFPRSAPFKTKHNGGTLMWATVASRRAPGYRTKAGAQLLWMIAIDPAKVAAGQDGSYPAFFLPFQDFQTSNHIGQWTEKIVGGNQQPPPTPPPPPPPPAPGPR